MNTVLVTAGCGQIGDHICSGLLKKGNAVIAVDTKDSGYNTGKDNFTFVEGAPTDKNVYGDLFENNHIDMLVHAAFTVDNDLGPIVTDKEISSSKQCDKFMFRYAINAGVNKIVLLSTDKVYDFPKTREPIREDGDLKINTNSAELKIASENALVMEMQHSKNVLVCITRSAPVYTLNFTDNLMSKITDPKDGAKFIAGKGQYGFQMCCVHNLVDFILCFVKYADNSSYNGIYNVGDKLLTTAADIVNFMREHHHLGTVFQRSGGGTVSKLKGIFGGNKEEKTNYRYLDMNKLEYNNMLDTTKASKMLSFRWDIHNTK